MAQHPDSGPDRPAKEYEIEITPEMALAGEEAMWAGLSGSEPSPFFDAATAAIEVFLAMLQAAPGKYVYPECLHNREV